MLVRQATYQPATLPEAADAAAPLVACRRSAPPEASNCPALTTPPCITAMNRARSSSTRISSIGSPSTTSRSRQLPRCDRAELVGTPHDFGAPLSGRANGFERREADVIDEKADFLGIVAVRIPGKAVVSTQTDAPTGTQDHPRRSAPPSSVSWWPSITACGSLNSGPRSTLAYSNCRAGTTGVSRASSMSSASASMNVPCSSVS